MPDQNPLMHYLYNSKQVMSYYQEAMRLGFWPEPDDKIDELSLHRIAAGISDITEIDRLLIDNEDLLSNYLSYIYSKRKNTWRVSPAFLCTLILIIRFANSFTASRLVELGWDKDLAAIVIEAAQIFKTDLVIT